MDLLARMQILYLEAKQTERRVKAEKKAILKMKEIEKLNKAIEDLIKIFCKKQDMNFEFWISDQIGGIASFGDIFYFSLIDIKIDIETNQPKGEIIRYLEHCIDNEDTISYSHWIENKVGTTLKS